MNQETPGREARNPRPSGQGEVNTRYMLDTVANPANGDVPALPSSVKVPGGTAVPVTLQAGYVNGSFAWKSRHPDVWIDVNGSDPKADVLDCENGDATPAQCPGWAKAHNATIPRFPAVIYANRSNLTPVFNAMNAAGLHVARDFCLWIATLDGTERVADMTGVVAVQAFGAAALGFNADLSFVYDDAFPKGASVPPPSLERHVVPRGNTLSFAALAASRNMLEDSFLAEQADFHTSGHLSAAHYAVLAAMKVAGDACGAAGLARPPLVAGTVYYTGKVS